MKKRTERLLTIKRIISSYRISSQDELLDKLYQATIMLDMKSIRRIINQIREFNDPVADVLSALADNYQYNVIVQSIDQIKERVMH